MVAAGIQLNNKVLQTAVFIMATVTLLLSGSATSSISAADPLYFGEPRQCELYEPVRCPPGTVEDGNFCRPLSSEFCRVFTGSPNVTTVSYGGESRPVCAAQTQLGTCSPGSDNYSPSGGQGSVAGIPTNYTNAIGQLITTFYAEKESFGGEEWFQYQGSITPIPASTQNIADFLFEGGQASQFNLNLAGTVRRTFTFVKNTTKRAVACVTQDNSPRQFLTIPVTMEIKRGRWDRAYDRQVVDLGFVLPKPADGNYYCKDRNHLAIVPDANNPLDYKCTESLTTVSRGCVVKELKSEGVAGQDQIIVSKCIRNLVPLSSGGAKGTGTRVFASQSGGLRAPGNSFTFSISDEGSSFCRQNAKDIFALRSNKGCSDFVTLDGSNNTLSADSEGSYSDCVKCLYGDSALVGELNPRLTVTQGTQPTETSPITPYNEPLATPISGRLYTDLGGCINASSTGSVVNTIVRVALGVMGGIVILRIIQGALTMQKGDPEGFQEGRDVITSALIGLLLLIFSAAMLNFLGINILGLDVATFGS
jgi:hypothetical protein